MGEGNTATFVATHNFEETKLIGAVVGKIVVARTTGPAFLRRSPKHLAASWLLQLSQTGRNSSQALPLSAARCRAPEVELMGTGRIVLVRHVSICSACCGRVRSRSGRDDTIVRVLHRSGFGREKGAAGLSACC